MTQDVQMTGREADVEAIRRAVADAERHQVDVEPFVALHTADAVIVNIAGRRVSGREAIREAMTAALATPLGQVLTRLEVQDVRFPRADVAIVTCVKHVSDNRDGGDGLPRTGCLVYVMVHEDGAWRIAHAQTTAVAQP